MNSITKALSVIKDVFGPRLYYSYGRGCVECALDTSQDKDLYFPVGRWTRDHTTQLRVLCETYGLQYSAAEMRRIVGLHARKTSRSEIPAALLALADDWDGVRRIDTALHKYWGADESAKMQTASRNLFLEIAERGLQHRVKHHLPTVLYAKQGSGMSLSLRALAGDLGFADESGDYLIGEAHIYGDPRLTEWSNVTTYIMTSNSPVPPFSVLCGNIDVDAIKADRTQLLGEAVGTTLLAGN